MLPAHDELLDRFLNEREVRCPMCGAHVEGVGPPYGCPGCGHRLRLGIAGSRTFARVRPWALTAFALAGVWSAWATWGYWAMMALGWSSVMTRPVPALSAIVGAVGVIVSVGGFVLTIRSRDDVRDAPTIARLPRLMAGAAACAAWFPVVQVIVLTARRG